MPPPALISLAARSSPSFACLPYSSTPPENGNTAPILIVSADFALVGFVVHAQQTSQTNEMKRIDPRIDVVMSFIDGKWINGIFICKTTSSLARVRSDRPPRP